MASNNKDMGELKVEVAKTQMHQFARENYREYFKTLMEIEFPEVQEKTLDKLYDEFMEKDMMNLINPVIQDRLEDLEVQHTILENDEKLKEKEKEKKQEGTKREPVFVTINNAFVKKGIETKDGRTFNSVTLPKNTMLGDQNIGGYQFYPKYIQDDRYRDNTSCIPLAKDHNVTLRKGEEKISIAPEELKQSLVESLANFKKESKLEKQKEKKQEELE